MLFIGHLIWPPEHNILIILDNWQSCDQSVLFLHHRRNINASAEALFGYSDFCSRQHYWHLVLTFKLAFAWQWLWVLSKCRLVSSQRKNIFCFFLICQSVHLSSLCYHNVIKWDSQFASEWEEKKRKGMPASSPKWLCLCDSFLQFLRHWILRKVPWDCKFFLERVISFLWKEIYPIYHD